MRTILLLLAVLTAVFHPTLGEQPPDSSSNVVSGGDVQKTAEKPDGTYETGTFAFRYKSVTLQEIQIDVWKINVVENGKESVAFNLTFYPIGLNQDCQYLIPNLLVKADGFILNCGGMFQSGRYTPAAAPAGIMFNVKIEDYLAITLSYAVTIGFYVEDVEKTLIYVNDCLQTLYIEQSPFDCRKMKPITSSTLSLVNYCFCNHQSTAVCATLDSSKYADDCGHVVPPIIPSSSTAASSSSTSAGTIPTESPYGTTKGVSGGPVSTTSATSATSTINAASTTKMQVATTTTSKTVPFTDDTDQQELRDELKNLADNGVGAENVTAVLNSTLRISSLLHQNLNHLDLVDISSIIVQASNLTGINETDANLVLQNVDAMLNANVSAFLGSIATGAPEKVLGSLPRIVRNANASTLTLSGQNLGFLSHARPCDKATALGMADDGQTFSHLDGSSSGHPVSIVLPGDVMCASAASHVMFTIHRTHKLHMSKKAYRVIGTRSGDNDELKLTLRRQDDSLHQSLHDESRLLSAGEKSGDPDPPDSDPPESDPPDITSIPPEILPDPCERQDALLSDMPILSATLLAEAIGETISKLPSGEAMADIKIDLSKRLRPLHGLYGVTWWDDVNLEWAKQDQCQVTLAGGVVSASCPHLTDFTVIVDGTMNDPAVCAVPLQAIGYILSVCSITSLLLIIVIAIMSDFLKMHLTPKLAFLFVTRTTRIDLFYCIVLFAFFSVFTIFSNDKVTGPACPTFAGIAYVLLMTCINLTLFQSYRVISCFAGSRCFAFLFRFANRELLVLIASASPPILLTVVLAVTSDFLLRSDGFCWIRPDYVAFAVVIPLTILVLNDIFCTAVVTWQIFRERSNQLILSDGFVRRRLISLLLMQFSLGLPWALQYFTIFAPSATVWHYFFTIAIGSQGIILLLLAFYRRERVAISLRKQEKHTMPTDSYSGSS